ncbi:MAG: hypothetical protein ABR548_04525 [Actinomycetota bacterium]|nr:hypothetical protein [Actinomycetota bacterium]
MRRYSGVRAFSIRRVFVISAVCAIIAMAAGSANAGKPTKGGGGGGSGSSTATLTCPSTATVGGAFTVTGSGYDPSKAVWMLVSDASGSTWANVAPASTGTISLRWTEYTTGTAKFAAHSSPNTSSSVLGSCSTSVS